MCLFYTFLNETKIKREEAKQLFVFSLRIAEYKRENHNEQR